MKKKKLSMHFVGIKGVGMTPLALIAKEAGANVTGSDVEEEFITDETLHNAGIHPLIGFTPEHITNPDMVITTGAHGGYDNPEVKSAKEKNIPVITAGEAVGVFMEGTIFNRQYKGISVAGTHGKTTTTAMIATILKEAGFDPSFIVGTGNVGSLGTPGHFGKGTYFIAEADEYATEPQYNQKAKFLWQHPQIAIFTNIELDHPDIYTSIDHVRNTFLEFARQLPASGTLIVCGDDREIQKLLKDYQGKVVTYGFNPDNQYILRRVNISGEQMFFQVDAYGGQSLDFVLRVVGEHNALNALAATIASLEAGVALEKIKPALMQFTGSKRRLEFIGQLTTGARVYDDYAHHPTEIKRTLQALRQKYPKQKIICIFQPHTYSRTKALFDDFLRVFTPVDEVIITDIYASLREEIDSTITAQMLAQELKNYHQHILYLPALKDVIEYSKQKRYRHDTVLVTMGAGDVYKIHSELQFS
jgi:UDP-N-acetylmuramate--alanine ligase